MPKNFSVSDYLALRSFEALFGPQFDISPCNTKICFSCQRGRADAPFLCGPFMGSAERGQLFLWNEVTDKVVHVPEPAGTGIFSPVWSPDGSRIAACLVDRASAYPVIISVETGEIVKLTERSLGLRPGYRPIEWLSTTEIACDLLDEGKLPLSLTVDTKAPEALIKEWQVALDGSCATAMLFSTEDKYPDIDFGVPVVLNIQNARITPYPEAQSRPDRVQHFVDRAEWPCPARQEPSPRSTGTRLVGFERPVQGDRILVDQADDGTRIIWETPQHGERVLPFIVNRHLAEVVSPGPIRLISFSTPTHANLFAKLILPPEESGQPPYPCVVEVYPGINVGKGTGDTDALNSHHPFNTQLLAQAGYAVLRPSIPHPEERDLGSFTQAQAVAVTNAISAATETGLIQLDDLHVLGHSYGGWAAMALLGATRLFRSGIASAGFYNLISCHGQIDARSRIEPVLDYSLSHRVEENWRLPGHPAEHINRYVAESPLFAVERVEAPVLFIHGDQDYIAVEQAEEMFSALRYYGKKAKFLRFAGEGHLIYGPYNIQAMYEVIFQWLREHRQSAEGAQR